MDDRQARRQINLLLAGTFLFWFSMYTYPSFLSAYAQEDLGASPVMIGLIVGSYGFTQMLLRIPLGLCSDISGKRRPFLILGMAAALAGAAGLALVNTSMGALVFRALSGVGASAWVAFSVLYSASFSPGQVSSAMGRLSFFQYGSQVIAMLLGAYLAQNVSKPAAFYLGALAGLVGIGVVWQVREAPAAASDDRLTLRALGSVVKDQSLLAATALSTIFHFACWGTVLGFTVNWASDVVGMHTSQLGLLAAMYLIPNTLVSRFSSGALARYLGEKCVMCLGFIITALSCALFAHAHDVISLYAVQALFGVGMGLIIPLTMSGAIVNIPHEKRGAAMGFYQSVYGVGMFLGPLLAGWVVERFSAGGDMVRGYSANFYLCAAISLLGLVVAIFAPGYARKSKGGK